MFYSTVLASAAIADTSRKDARLREWERLVQEARNELQAIEDAQHHRIASLLQKGESTPSAARSLNEWETLFDSAKQTMDDREALGFLELPGPPLSLLKRLNTSEIQQLMSDPVIARLKESTDCESAYTSERQVLSEKKLKTIAWSVRKLAFRLLESSKKASVDRFGVAVDEHLSQSRRESISTQSQLRPVRSRIDFCTEKLSFLLSRTFDAMDWRHFEPPTSPTYHRMVDDDTLSPNHYLHTALKRFKKFRKNDGSNDQRIQKLLSDVSAILFNSRLPPDINFFNSLITWLVRLKRWTDVRAVIETMRESHIRPNKMTLTLMLRFYAIIKDQTGFDDMTLKMKGMLGGLAIANPNLSRTHSVRWRYMAFERRATWSSQNEMDKWLLRNDEEPGILECRSGSPAGAVWRRSRRVPILREIARMNCMNIYVYGALIDGSLKFDQPKAAMTYYLQMIEDGWNTNIKVLGSILDYCLRLQDWEAGVTVWRQICVLADGASRAALSSMLELCRCKGRHVEFGEVLEYGVRNRVLPPTIWDFPEKIAEESIPDLLRRADVAASSGKLTLKISQSSDLFEHSLELLAYRIAKTALDIAGLDPGLGKSSTSFNIHLRIRKDHKESPRALMHEKKKAALQGLANRVEQDKHYRYLRSQGVESKNTLTPIEPWHERPREHNLSSAKAILWESIPLDFLTPSPAPEGAAIATPSDLHEAAPSTEDFSNDYSVENVESATTATKEDQGPDSGIVSWTANQIQDFPQPSTIRKSCSA